MNAQSKIEPAPLVAVLARVLPTLGAVHKNKKNPAFKSNYADLSAVLEAVAPVSEHGLWFRQVPVQIDGGIGIETIYVHESGEELSAGITPVPVNKNDAQGLGSALSYGRRYGLLTAFGLSAEDDDGNAAARGQSNRTVSPTAAPLSPADYAKFVQLVESTKSNIPLLMQAIGLPKTYTYEQLTRPQYDVAIEALSAKLAALAKRETNAKAEEPA